MKYYDHVPLEMAVTLCEGQTLNYKCLKLVAFFMEIQQSEAHILEEHVIGK